MQVSLRPVFRCSPYIIALTVFSLLAPALMAERVPGQYIVELNTEPVAEHLAKLPRTGTLSGRVRGAEADSHRATIMTQQRDLRSRFADRNATVVDSVTTVANALII